MSDFEDEQLPPDLTDLADRLSSSRPIASDDALARVMTRAQRAGSGRRFAAWRPRSRGGRRTVATGLVGVAMALGVVGTASALTVSLAGLGPTLIADIKAKLNVTTPAASVDVELSDPAQAQYLGAPCLSALVTLGQLQAGAVIDSLTVTLQNGVVELLCGVAQPTRILSSSAASIDFEDTPRGSNSATKTVTFTNIGNTPLSVTAASIPPLAQFNITASSCTSVNLDVGETCKVTARFSPPSLLNATGLKTSALTVTSTAPTVTVALRATAT